MKEYEKWDYTTHSYKPYYVPDDKKLITFSLDMNEIVNCCQCLEPIRYGDGYTSLEVHSGGGFGYAVCPKCYEEEWERRRVWENGNG